MFTVLNKEIVRFLFVGGLSTMIHVVSCLFAAHEFNFRPELANLVGYLCAVMASYIGHSFFTFKASDAHAFQVPRFIVLSLTGLFASSLITYVACTILGKSLLTAMVITTFTVPLVTYIGAKFWVFSQSERQER